MKRNRIRGIVQCAVFAALIAVGAFIRIPAPIVPVTLQTLFTTMAGMLLGPKKGAAAVGIYVVTGLIGISVFAEGGGIAYVLRPSFGYLIGFAAGAYITGRIADGPVSVKRLIFAAFAGIFAVYAIGIVYCYIINRFVTGTSMGFAALALYSLVPVPGDCLTCFIAAGLCAKIRRIMAAEKRSELMSGDRS